MDSNEAARDGGGVKKSNISVFLGNNMAFSPHFSVIHPPVEFR